MKSVCVLQVCFCQLLFAALPVADGLVMHLDASQITGVADGGSLGTWTDLSGAGNNATQTTTNAQPTYVASSSAFNDYASVSFVTDDWMELPNVVSVNSFTLFLVGKFNANGSEQYFISGYDAGLGGNNRLRIAEYGWSSVMRFRVGTTDYTGLAKDLNAHTFMLNSVSQAWEDDTFFAGQTNSYTTTPNIRLGTIYGTSGFLNGEIAEVVLYNRVLTVAETELVRTYLSDKYTVPVSPADLVAGNMMLINENAGWCWYQDEKIIYDPVSGDVITSTTNESAGFGGTSNVETTAFDLATGKRTRVYMKNNGGDDHNMGAFWIRPDGRYLHMHTGHNANDYSYCRTTVNPNDGTSWSAESSFNWETLSGLSDSGNLTYHNLHYLSAEGTGNGRLYNISRQFDRSPYIVYSDNWGQTWAYAGKLSSPTTGTSYSNGYFKYASNGVDRIDFIATEHHPRDYNNNIYHGYIQGGKSYNSDGTEIDNSIFDENAPGPEEFTPVFLSGAIAAGQYHTAWTIELELDENDYPVCLFITRYGTELYGANDGRGAADHRIFYGRFDGSSWTYTELSKIGQGLESWESDYTGLGCIHPDNPNLIYISTPFDPRDDTEYANHEIFKGVTADNGATWNWTQITFDSTVDNLRPAVPRWDANNTALFWLRGYYPAFGSNPQADYDQVLVGMIDRHNEAISLVTYIDADPSNTTNADSSPFTPTGPSGIPGAADDQWHEYTEYGNAGSCYTANESSEDAPMLKTTISGLANGTYDVFAYFWCHPSRDWGVAGGFTPSDILYFNRQSSQHAEASEFFGSVSIIDYEALLYRVYIGRREVVGGASIDVYIDDYDSSLVNGADRAVYDGVGVASVIPDYAGDLYRDGKVNYMDMAELGQGWQTIYDMDTLVDIATNWLAGL